MTDPRTAVAMVLLRLHYGRGVDIDSEWKRRSEDGREYWRSWADEVIDAARTPSEAVAEAGEP
jgi:hypothetical protein